MKKEEKELCDQNDRRRTVNPMIMKEQGRRQTRQTRQKKKCYRCGRDGYHIARSCDYTTDRYGVELRRYAGRLLWRSRRQPWTNRRHDQIGQIARVAKQETPSVIRSICDTLLKFRPAAEQAGLTVRQYPGGHCNEYWGRKSKPRLKRRGKLCYRCRRPNHIARQCRFHIDVFGNSIYSRGTATTTAIRQQVKVETEAVGHPTEQVTEIERETETKNEIIENKKREVVNTQSKSMTPVTGVVTLGDTVSSRSKVDIIGQPTELELETETIIETENEIIENERLKRDFVTIQSKSMTPGMVALVDAVSSGVKVDIIGQPTELESETMTTIEQNLEDRCEELRRMWLRRCNLDQALRVPQVKYAVRKDLKGQIRRLDEEIKQRVDEYDIAEGERRKMQDIRSSEQFRTDPAETGENLMTEQTKTELTCEDMKLIAEQTEETKWTEQTMENVESEQTVEELQRKTEQTEQTEQILENVELKTEQIQMTDNVGTEQGVDSVDAEKRVDSAGDEETVDNVEAEQSVEDIGLKTEQTEQTNLTMDKMESEQTIEELKTDQTDQTIEELELKTDQTEQTVKTNQTDQTGQTELTVDKEEALQGVYSVTAETEQSVDNIGAEQSELTTDKMDLEQTMEVSKLKTDQNDLTMEELELKVDSVEDEQNVDHVGNVEMEETTSMTNDARNIVTRMSGLDKKMAELEKVEKDVKREIQAATRFEDINSLEKLEHCRATVERLKAGNEAERVRLREDSYSTSPVYTIIVRPIAEKWNECARALEFKSKYFFDIHWRVITLRDQWNHKPMIEMEDSRLRVLRGLITDIDDKLYDDNDMPLSDHQVIERAEALTQLDDFVEQYIDHSNTVSGFQPLRECSRQSRRDGSYRTLVFHKEDLRIMELYEDNYWSAIQIICQTAENDGRTDPRQVTEHSWRCTAARKALEKHRETFHRQVVEEPVENVLECEKVAVVSTKAEEELEKKQKEEMGNVELYRRPYEELTVEEAKALEDEFYARTYAEDRTGTKFEGRPWRAMYNGMTWSSFNKTRRNMLEPVSTTNEMNEEEDSRSEATSENSAWEDRALWGDNACFTDYSSDEEEE